MKCWVIPEGPSLDPQDKKLAVRVPDPDFNFDTKYMTPDSVYGSGPMTIWDQGEYEMLEPKKMIQGLEQGKIELRLKGEILKGIFMLVKMTGMGRERAWHLIKKRDVHAKRNWKASLLAASH